MYNRNRRKIDPRYHSKFNGYNETYNRNSYNRNPYNRNSYDTNSYNRRVNGINTGYVLIVGITIMLIGIGLKQAAVVLFGMMIILSSFLLRLTSSKEDYDRNGSVGYDRNRSVDYDRTYNDSSIRNRVDRLNNSQTSKIAFYLLVIVIAFSLVYAIFNLIVSNITKIIIFISIIFVILLLIKMIKANIKNRPEVKKVNSNDFCYDDTDTVIQYESMEEMEEDDHEETIEIEEKYNNHRVPSVSGKENQDDIDNQNNTEERFTNYEKSSDFNLSSINVFNNQSKN